MRKILTDFKFSFSLVVCNILNFGNEILMLVLTNCIARISEQSIFFTSSSRPSILRGSAKYMANFPPCEWFVWKKSINKWTIVLGSKHNQNYCIYIVWKSQELSIQFVGCTKIETTNFGHKHCLHVCLRIKPKTLRCCLFFVKRFTPITIEIDDIC